MPLSPRKWMWVSLCLTLVLGLCLGIVVDRLLLGGRDGSGERRHHDRSQEFMTRLETELKLTAEQREQLDKALGASREKARAFWNETAASYDELRKGFRAEIRELLTPQQQRLFDEMMAREDARRSEHERRRP